MIDPPPPASSLIRALERKRARAAPLDIGELALLRRNLAHLPDRLDPRALALVVGYCAQARASQDAALLTACLWAARHRGGPPAPCTWNLGRALRNAPADQSERVWRGLCAASRSALPRAAAGAIGVLAANDLPTDWHRLHRDLRSWYQGSQDAVIRRWCTGLYGPVTADGVVDPPDLSVPRTSEVSP